MFFKRFFYFKLYYKKVVNQKKSLNNAATIVITNLKHLGCVKTLAISIC